MGVFRGSKGMFRGCERGDISRLRTRPTFGNSAKSFSIGVFRAPARGTFARGGKSTQKRHLNLRFKNPPTLYTSDFDTLYHAFTEHGRCRAV